jgi:hypothetical protein
MGVGVAKVATKTTGVLRKREEEQERRRVAG